MTIGTFRRSRRARRGSGGFTVIELAVASAVLVTVIVAVLTLFDFSSRLARVQTNVTDMQQAHRGAQNLLVRYTRLAGRGGLPYSLAPVATPAFAGKPLPSGLGIDIRSNVGATEYISPGDATTPQVLDNTDVLTVRGVINTPVYLVNPSPEGSMFILTPDATNPTGGSLLIEDPVLQTGLPQDLRALAEALDPANPVAPEAVVLVSPLENIFAVVQINRATSSVDDFDNPKRITLGFTIGTPGGTNPEDRYLALSPGGRFSSELRSVAAVGLVEEYRFYVREEFSVPGDATTAPTPRLSMARYFPGTETPYANNPLNLRADLADNIIDLQLALGVDVNRDETVTEADPPDAADEWLFNATADDPNDAATWNGPQPLDPPGLFYLRLTTLARSARPDPGHVAAAVAQLEDHVYGETDTPADDAERLRRSFRRRTLQTVVDLRNM